MPAQINFQPTLFIFIGTTSGQIGWRLKKQLVDLYGKIPILRYLWIDTNNTIEPRAAQWFDASERVELTGFDPAGVIAHLQNYPTIKSWWPNAKVNPGVMFSGAPSQMRLVGRMAFFRKYNDRNAGAALYDRLKQETQALTVAANHRKTEQMSTPQMDFQVAQGIRVYLVFSPGGGTGSSQAFDLAYLCRSLLQGHQPEIAAFILMPSVIEDLMQGAGHAQRRKMLANSYAWFREEDWLSEKSDWKVKYPEGAPLDIQAPPFNHRYVISIYNQGGFRLQSADDIFDMLAHAIALDTGSSMAGAMRGFTDIVQVLGERFEGKKRSFSSLAAASLLFPRQRLMAYCSARLGRELLLNGLLGKDAEDAEAGEQAMKQRINPIASTLLANCGLRVDDLLSTLVGDAAIRLDYKTQIQGAQTVDAALSLVDTQENLNEAARTSEAERIASSAETLKTRLAASLDKELLRLIGLYGLKFTRRVLKLLSAEAQEIVEEADIYSLAGLKSYLSAKGVQNSQMENARQEYKKARNFIYNLDNGPEDKLERVFNLKGWEKKFSVGRQNIITSMKKVNDLAIRQAAGNQAMSLYDQLLAWCLEKLTQFDAYEGTILKAASALQLSADQSASKETRQAQQYEFRQEIEINFADYYHDQTADIRPENVFQTMIPAVALEKSVNFKAWLDNNKLQADVQKHAASFFAQSINETSLLGALQAIAERRGQQPQVLVHEEMEKLLKYCHPFWSYDQNTGLHDLEGKSILGVEDAASPLIPEEYRNDGSFEINETGLKDRIDVVRTWHGLPAFMLKEMLECKVEYDNLREKSDDPLHIIPIDNSSDINPEKGGLYRDTFAVALAWKYIVQVGSFYYYDPEKAYTEKNIRPAKEFKLDQGREKAEDSFAAREDWAKQVEDAIDNYVRNIGNTQAINELEAAIQERYAALGRMGPDDTLRKQYEKEIRALQKRQRDLGKV